MEITTNRGNTYSYIPITNEIAFGTVEEKFEWTFNPLKFFKSLDNVAMFIIGMTEQCNLRCRYCCYSGSYQRKRLHGSTCLSREDMHKIIGFVESLTDDNPKRIAFYGGEPLLNFDNIRHCVEICRQRWGQSVSFSISTNATLLTQEMIEWLIKNDVEIAISLDGPKYYHDRNRVFGNGQGSFDRIKTAIKSIYEHSSNPNISFHVTLANVREIISMAKAWAEDEMLKEISPTVVHGLTPNFKTGVSIIGYEDVREFYSDMIDAYEQHPDWRILKVFLDEIIAPWKERMVFEIEGPIELSTCLPVNTKLYIDSNMEIGVCEKFSDDFRIGSVFHGIDYEKANKLVKNYYDKKVERCSRCPILRMCDICITSLEYTPSQMELLCHNERVYSRVSLYAFCEMAERGMIE